MIDTTNPAQRAAAVPPTQTGPVTLVNSFVVDPARDEVFTELWTETSLYFREQPGFIGLRLHRAVSPEAHYRYVNVARWESAEQFSAAHRTERFRELVSQPAWREYPSNPVLYEVAVEHPVGA